MFVALNVALFVGCWFRIYFSIYLKFNFYYSLGIIKLLVLHYVFVISCCGKCAVTIKVMVCCSNQGLNWGGTDQSRMMGKTTHIIKNKMFYL